MANTTFIVKIDEKGGMDFGSEYNLARFRQFCKDNIGKTLKIEKQISTRSLNQNQLYWLFLGVIERETGNNANELHEYFRRTLLAPKFIKVLGKEIKIPKSTTELSKLEFADYLDKISSETEIQIPDSEAYNNFQDTAPLTNH